MSSKFDISISSILNIQPCGVSDQQLDSDEQCIPSIDNNIHWSQTKHRDQICKSISEACKGRTAWNKGIPNPAAAERMKKNNPRISSSGFKKGHKFNEHKRYIEFRDCIICGTEFQVPVRHKSMFTCGKSCAGTYSNHKRSNTLYKLNLTTTCGRTS